MVAKRSIQCPECKRFIDIFKEEDIPLKGIVLKCNCGCKLKCIKETKYINKWREIKGE